MNTKSQLWNPDELLMLLRFCAHSLILAYDETLQTDFWEASEKATQACQHLMAITENDNYSVASIH